MFGRMGMRMSSNLGQSNQVAVQAWSTWAVVKSTGAVIGFCVLVALGAQVRIPIPGTVVPMTLQSLAVLLAGYMLAPRLAAGAMLLYLACGTVYAPLFAGVGGLWGPTCGYLVGFVLAAWLVSTVRGSGQASFLRLLAAGAVGLVVLFALGVAVGSLWMGGLKAATVAGFVPFAVKAVVQLFLAVSLVRCVSGLKRKTFPGL